MPVIFKWVPEYDDIANTIQSNPPTQLVVKNGPIANQGNLPVFPYDTPNGTYEPEPLDVTQPKTVFSAGGQYAWVDSENPPTSDDRISVRFDLDNSGTAQSLSWGEIEKAPFADIPTEFEGEAQDIQLAVSQSINFSPVSIERNPPTNYTDGSTNVCGAQWTNLGANGGGPVSAGYILCSTNPGGPDSDYMPTTVNPIGPFEMRPQFDCDPFPHSGLQESWTVVYAYMDGDGTVFQGSYVTGNGWDIQTGSVGDDETAISLVRQAYQAQTGNTLPDDASGYAQYYASLPGPSYSVSNLQAGCDWSAGGPVTGQILMDIHQSNRFFVYSNSPAPVALPPASFVYPTGDDQYKYRKWSIPPFNTRIPFQNYSYSVANVQLKKGN